MHIKEAQRLIPEPTECAKLFHEFNFVRHRWFVYTANGYSSTMPFFQYHLEKLEYEENSTEWQDVTKFMRFIMDKMQLVNECIVISLIYLEQIML